MSAGAVMLYEFTNALILRGLPRFTRQSNATITLARSPFVFPRFPVSLTVFSRGIRFPPLSKNIDRLLSVDIFLAESI